VQRENELVAAGERRLMRLGFDLHDGPLQELVALAEEAGVPPGVVNPLFKISPSFVASIVQNASCVNGLFACGLRIFARYLRIVALKEIL
jgi:hypothetical protein